MAKLVERFYSADGVHPPQPQPSNNGSWSWSLRLKVKSWNEWLRGHLRLPIPDDPGGNIIQEEGLDNFEQETLLQWAKYDRSMFDDEEHPAGEVAPGTILLHLEEWLGDHQGIPVPFE